MLYEVALTLLPNLGPVLVRQLISYCGSAEAVFKEGRGKLQKVPGIGTKLAEIIASHHTLDRAQAIIEQAEKQDVKLLFYTDKNYPSRLQDIKDAPCLLYSRGNGNLNKRRSISIVGTRNATAYGKGVCQEIIGQLAHYSPLIVSGLAYGIDIEAHRSALKHGLPTLGVLGSGVDVIYPKAHQHTAMEMLEHGGLLSEQPFGEKPNAINFPARNRIIAGMSDAVIVVEAKKKGGAVITAEIAFSYHKEVFAVPGRLTDECSQGCNELIKQQKANIFTSVEQLEHFLNWHWQESKTMQEKILFPDSLKPEERAIVEVLTKQGTTDVDRLSRMSQIPIHKLPSLLLNLELYNLVRPMPGKKFQLVRK